jgi:hypothetical protein
MFEQLKSQLMDTAWKGFKRCDFNFLSVRKESKGPEHFFDKSKGWKPTPAPHLGTVYMYVCM